MITLAFVLPILSINHPKLNSLFDVFANFMPLIFFGAILFQFKKYKNAFTSISKKINEYNAKKYPPTSPNANQQYNIEQSISRRHTSNMQSQTFQTIAKTPQAKSLNVPTTYSSLNKQCSKSKASKISPPLNNIIKNDFSFGRVILGILLIAIIILYLGYFYGWFDNYVFMQNLKLIIQNNFS